MRKLVLILLAFFAACTFLRVFDTAEAAELENTAFSVEIPVEINR
jgi:hypothetical protein